MRSGSECKRKNTIPNMSTEPARIMAVMTMRMSVSPGGVMNDGRWCEASG
jgi:hypothetical protein